MAKALSECVKKQNQSKKETYARTQACAEYLAELARPAGVPRTSRATIAKKWKVSPDTLGHDAAGKTTLQEFNAKKQHLSPAEERKLIDFVKGSADRGMPLSHKQICTFAEAIRARQEGPKEKPIAEGWSYAFIDRHRDELQMHWSKLLDMQRAQCLNPATVKHWFDLVKEFVVDLGIRTEDLYGMDKTGCPTGVTGKERVVGGRGTKTQHKTGGADRENITVIVTICADGTKLRPFVIFKGVNLMTKWADNNVADATIAVSGKGWTDEELAYQWMIQDFDPLTKDKADGRTRVLLLDGHKSHYSLQLLEYAKANNIIILGYPPHCTHALQGLDVVCFSKMKDEWKKEIRAFEDRTLSKVSKTEFLEVYGTAFKNAFTPESIKAAFEKTGVMPYNPGIITETQMKPSETTSVRAGFVVEMSSLARAVAKSFRQYNFTEADIDPTLALVSSSPLSPLRMAGTRKRTREEGEEDEDDSPSKRMRFMVSGLASTSSGSFLVSKAPLTSSQPLIPLPPASANPFSTPDWSLLHEDTSSSSLMYPQLLKQHHEMERSLRLAKASLEWHENRQEADSAHMVLQDMSLEKMKRALHGKENKVSNKTKLFTEGRGRVWTADEVIVEIAKVEQAKKDKEAKKKGNRAACGAARVVKEAAEKEWASTKEAHHVALALWDEEYKRMKGMGTRVKDLPKKPICPPKPEALRPKKKQVSAAAVVEGSAHAEGEGGDSEGEEDGDENGSDNDEDD